MAERDRYVVSVRTFNGAGVRNVIDAASARRRFRTRTFARLYAWNLRPQWDGIARVEIAHSAENRG